MKNYKLVNIVSQSKSVFAYLLLISIVALPLGVQAQYTSIPADYDRLLLGETLTNGIAVSGDANCKTTGVNDCSGVLYMRFANPSVSGSTMSFDIEARAGQEAIGSLLVPAVLGRCEGGLFDTDIESVCVNNAGGTFIPGSDEIPGTIDADNSANVMFAVRAQIFYSKILYPDTTSLSGCTPSQPYSDSMVADVVPTSTANNADAGEHSFDYQSDNSIKAADPGTIDPANLLQWQPDTYQTVMSIDCPLPANSENNLWGMTFHPSGHNQNGHHIFGNVFTGFARYSHSPENSLEFFPLDNSNYITHAEIAEDGLGVLIEYAQAVTIPTGGTYQFTAVDGTAIALTSDATWLNDRTVWLTLGSDIYAGVNVAATALDSDRHVLVGSTFPSDTSFGDIANFGRASTYRAVLTRHASDMDLARTAPRITGIEVADGTESIALTFNSASPVCGSPGTGCAELTADHFEVMHYEGDISETGAPTLLTISSVGLTGDATAGYTAATLNINLPGSIDASGSSVTIDSDDRLLVRTARNSRFTDGFITDRTIFSQASTSRSVPRADTPTTYSEAESGMLHLQSGALVQAIPVIEYTYTLTDAGGNPVAPGSIPEGGSAERTTLTFTITRAPEGVNFETNVTVTNTEGGDPAGFDLSGDIDANRVITFAAGDNVRTILFSFTGDDDEDDDNVYTISIGDEIITFRIVGSESGLTLLDIDNRDIAERAIENEGVQQLFIGVYSSTETSNAITAAGGTFTVTQIKLNITSGISIDAEVNVRGFSASQFGFGSPSEENNNEFTYDSVSDTGVDLDDANNFLKLLEFGINSDEPTDGSDTLDVTLELTITERASDDGTERERPPVMATRTINEINDPIEFGPGLRSPVPPVTVSVRDLMSAGSSVTPLRTTVNDGGEGNAVTVVISPTSDDTLRFAAYDCRRRIYSYC